MLAGYLGNLRARHVRAADDKIHLSNTPSFLCVREAPSSKESVIYSPVQLVIPAEIREKSLPRPPQSDTPKMVEYSELRNPELREFLQARRLPGTGTKAVLVQRLQESDIFYTSFSSQQHRAHSNPLLEDILEKMKTSDPRVITKMLRKLVHAKNLHNTKERMKKPGFGKYRSSSSIAGDYKKLASGYCLEWNCSLCCDASLSKSLNHLLGYGSTCWGRKCKDLNNCSGCRDELLGLEDAYIQRREKESYALIPLSRPDGIPGPIHHRWMPSDVTLLKQVLTDVRSMVHNEHLGKLLLKLKDEEPDAVEWVNIKQTLANKKCLGSNCSACGTATLTESLDALSDGLHTDCGGDVSSACSNIITCSSCRHALQNMENILSRNVEEGRDHEPCKTSLDCDAWSYLATGLNPLALYPQHDNTNLIEKASQVEKHCQGENLRAMDTYDAGKRTKYEHKGTQTEGSHDIVRQSCFREHGQCDRPDQDLSYGLFHPSSETSMDLDIRNDELRRRRVKRTKTSLTESSDGTMRGASRKRRFSNLDLHYTLPADYLLAKQVRAEEDRERQERERALSRHERPSWFGTPQDPLPDLWMGRPVLSATGIGMLKAMDSIPKYYLSNSEETMISYAKTQKDRRFSDIIRRLEAELMSRDFWMQSLGYDSSDGFGNIPAGDYRLKHEQSDFGQERESNRVERWVSTLPRF
ncbi:hypothetical protein KCU81_g8418, partial [Aureobasidium melanogenum]